MDDRVYEQLVDIGDKRGFVQTQLTPMLREATCGYVLECSYERVGCYEIVNVTCSRGSFEKLTFGVNVTADSLWAIVKDVMRAVSERFE